MPKRRFPRQLPRLLIHPKPRAPRAPLAGVRGSPPIVSDSLGLRRLLQRSRAGSASRLSHRQDWAVEGVEDVLVDVVVHRRG